MSLDAAAERDLLAVIPDLRALAIALCRNSDRADDLVQETMLRALLHFDQFHPGTNLLAWLYTILRNHHHSEWRKRSRISEDPDGTYAESLTVPPDQEGWSVADDFRAAFDKLPARQQHALILVAADGLSYEQAAAVAKSNVGTIKSRVNRARCLLAEYMSYDRPLAMERALGARREHATRRSTRGTPLPTAARTSAERVARPMRHAVRHDEVALPA